MEATSIGLLAVSSLVVLAWLYAYSRDRRTAVLLLERFGAMLPTSLAYVAVFGVAIVVELARSDGRVTPVVAVAGVMAIVFSWCGSWYVNDVYDIDADKHSDEDRATADGRLTATQTTAAAVVLCGASMGYAALVNPYAVAGTGAMIALNLVYSIPPLRLKRSGIGSMVAIGLMGATAVFVGSAAVASAPSATTWRLAGIITLLMTINLSYTDLKDEEHDARAGVENFVVRYGRERVRRFLMVSLPVSYVVSALVLGIRHTVSLGIVTGLGLTATALLATHDATKPALVYRLDVVNSLYLVAIAVSYYFVYVN